MFAIKSQYNSPCFYMVARAFWSALQADKNVVLLHLYVEQLGIFIRMEWHPLGRPQRSSHSARP